MRTECCGLIGRQERPCDGCPFKYAPNPEPDPAPSRQREIQFLKQEGYECVTIDEAGGKWYAVSQLLFTSALIGGELALVEDEISIRYCYHSLVIAAAALEEWKARGFEGDPIGWHRHLQTGRRRPNGSEKYEYIEP